LDILHLISEAIQSGDSGKAKQYVEKALSEGLNAKKIVNDSMMKAMNVVGERFKNHEIFVPEIMVAARAMKSGMEVLEPELVGSQVEKHGVVIIGTVKGDLHDIGKNLVAMMLEGAGFDVIDLGIDVEADEFVNKLKETNADILAMSALLTTTMTEMKEVIEILREESLKGEVKVLIGGAPITEDFSKQIGADEYAGDAGSAVSKAKSLILS